MAVLPSPAIELITGLEPIAGAGLAINVAYLALDRFRYRRRIEPVAEEKCVLNDEQDAFEGFHDLDPVKELKWLARRVSSKDYVPRGRAAAAYRYGFRKHQDIFFAGSAASMCAFTVATGVALSVGRWEWAHFLTISPFPGVLFYACLASMIIPVGVVLAGRRCANWGRERIEHCTNQVAISLGNLAKQAQPPVGVERREPLPPAPRPAGSRPLTAEEASRLAAELAQRRREHRDS